MITRDPALDKLAQDLLLTIPEECKRRFAVRDYKDPDYVPTEVLATLVRARFGTGNGVLDAATRVFLKRLIATIAKYLKANPQWDRVVSSDSETRRLLDFDDRR